MLPETSSAISQAEEVFRPWRNKGMFAALLVALAACFLIVCRLESSQVLESQIALGIHPTEAATFVALAIAAVLLVLTLLAIRARRSLVATGELRVSTSRLFFSGGPSNVAQSVDDLRGIACRYTGAGTRMQFREGVIELPGQWLPPDWRRTWRGWQAPGGAAIRLSRKSHPLLAALHARRPDLRPKLSGIWFELLLGLLLVIAPKISIYPLYAEARRTVSRQSVDDVAIKAFQEGRYEEACAAYRTALPSLKQDLYGSQHAAEFLSYCGDPKGAVEAFVGFEGQPLWPDKADPIHLAQLRIARGRYDQAENLLEGRPSYLLYVTLAEQCRHKEAEEVLGKVAEKDGLAKVLVFRHRGSDIEATTGADALCETFVQHKPWTPSWLARVFESCILAGGASKAMEDSRFAPAVRALPGLRAELIQFTEREAPGSANDLKVVMRQLDHGK